MVTLVGDYQPRLGYFAKPTANSLYHTDVAVHQINPTGNKGLFNLPAQFLAVHQKQHLIFLRRCHTGYAALYYRFTAAAAKHRTNIFMPRFD